MQTLSGRVAVITGGASGIGLAVAEAFARRQMHVVIADRRPDRFEGALARINAAGDAAAVAIETDVRDADAVQHLANRVLERHGAIHVVCNNAGMSTLGYAWDTPLDQWQELMAVNLFGVINGVRSFVPILQAQDEAHLVNTASLAGLLTSAGSAPYSASKHAVIGLTKALRAELAIRWPHVGVSVLCPGEVATNLADETRSGGRDRDLAKVEALRARLAHAMAPSVVANAVVEGISDGRFWILPAGGAYLDGVRREMDELLGPQ
jgi:NAD(P)-dependent dehydrogenase (short-subunit alcohol dehydrogenase family)